MTRDVQIITADFVLPIEDAPFAQGGVAIADGTILAIGSKEKLFQQYPRGTPTHFAQGVLLPGLINPHLIVDSNALARRLTAWLDPNNEHFNFVEWLLTYAELKSQLQPEELSSSIQSNLIKAQASGITTLGAVSSWDDSIQLYEKSPLRIVAFVEILNLNKQKAAHDFESAISNIEKIAEREPGRISPGLAPFSAFTLSKNLLKILAQHADQYHLPVHLHVAETFSEMEFFYASKGDITDHLFPEAGWKEIPPPHQMTPIQYLREIDFLKPNLILMGCLHLGATDLAILEQAHAKILFAPQPFYRLKLGEIPFQKTFAASITTALATLGSPWGGGVSLWEELRATITHLEKNSVPFTYEELLKKVTLEAAKCLLMEQQIGSLKKDKRADLLVVNTQAKDISELATRLILDTGEGDIQAMWVEGIRIP